MRRWRFSFRGGFRLRRSGFRESLRFVNCIEEKFVRAVRLASPLWPKAQQIDASLTVLHFYCCCFPLNSLGMQQIPAHQRTLLFRIRGEYAAAKPVFGLERWTALKHDDRIVWQTPYCGSSGVLQFHTQQTTRTEKLLIFQPAQAIFHRQAEIIDGEQ